MTSIPPPYEHPGSPPVRPELPEGVLRPDSRAPPGGRAEGGGTLDAGSLPPWPPWSPFAGMLVTVVIALIGVTVIAVVAAAFGADVGGDDTPPGVTIGGTFVQDLALIVSALLFARITAGRPTPWQFGLRRVPLGPAAGRLLLAWLAFFAFSAAWAAALGITESDNLPQELGADDSTLALIAVAVLVAVVAPITEELFFRGFLFTAMRRWIGLIPGALAAGVIFGLIHVGSAEAEFLPPLAFFGLVLCLLYHWTGSLLPCMVLHALNNSLALGVSQHWSFAGVVGMMLASSLVVLAIALHFSPPDRAGTPLPVT